MHELVRNKNKFTIAKPQSSEFSIPPQYSDSVLPLELESELDKAVWRQFVSSEGHDQQYIKTCVSQSWARCQKMGIDPGLKKCKKFREEESFDGEHRFLRNVVKNTSGDLAAFLEHKGLLFTICDRDGFLTGTIGSYQALRMADAIHFGPGADWTEPSVGTNAIGTALTSGLPQRVVGAEHFCTSHQNWTCSAAPIFGVDGSLHGCVDISGPIQADHSRNLALSAYYARAIEALLFQEQCMGMIGRVLNKNTIGLLTLDRFGRIYYCNSVAASLFGSSPRGLSGKNAAKWFDLSPFFDHRLSQGWAEHDTMLELRCLHNPTWSIYAAPLINTFHHLHGLTLCIYPPAPPRPANYIPLRRENDALDAMIGQSRAFTRLVAKARRVAATDSTALITGPSGTGKEVLARALHQASPRDKKPFVAVNCGAIAADLIQSELFGYAEGAFTGARRGGQAGKFEQAIGGTIFLDEIGEMPLNIQVNLLRILDDKHIIRVGGKQSVPVDVRVIAATNRDLEAMVEEGKFRQDLYYRLHVVSLNLPPLREREEDVQLLADAFIKEFAQALGQEIKAVAPEFRQALAAYRWPGNIRELRHVIESTLILLDDETLHLESLPRKIQQAVNPEQGHKPEQTLRFPSLNFADIQKQALQQALEQYEGNISQMAKAMGIGRNTTYAKLKKFNLL